MLKCILLLQQSRAASRLRFARTSLALLTAFALTTPVSASPIFTGLGTLSNWRVSVARAVSDNGEFVVGYNTGPTSGSSGNRQAFVWSKSTGMTSIGQLPGTSIYSDAYGVTNDGATIVGEAQSGTGVQAMRWTIGSGMQVLGELAGGPDRGTAYAVSADGSTIVGASASGTDQFAVPVFDAFRWTSASGMATITTAGRARAVSADGSVTVGYNVLRAFQWTSSSGIAYLPVGADVANGISSDGSIVVGYDDGTSTDQAFLWTATSGISYLGDLPGGAFASYAYGVSDDGSIVVGRGTAATGSEAFIWREGIGMMSLKDWLIEIGLGTSVSGWKLVDAYDISADGLTIVGQGTNPLGTTEAFIITVPEVSSISMLCVILILAASFRAVRSLSVSQT